MPRTIQLPSGRTLNHNEPDPDEPATVGYVNEAFEDLASQVQDGFAALRDELRQRVNERVDERAEEVIPVAPAVAIGNGLSEPGVRQIVRQEVERGLRDAREDGLAELRKVQRNGALDPMCARVAEAVVDALEVRLDLDGEDEQDGKPKNGKRAGNGRARAPRQVEDTAPAEAVSWYERRLWGSDEAS